MKMKMKKRKGFAGIDSSGSATNLPIYICCSYSEKKDEFDKLYENIRQLVIKRKTSASIQKGN